MPTLWQPSLVRATDGDGNPYDGAKMYFYLTGTTTNALYYLDADGSTAGSHPLVSDADGKFSPAFLDDGVTYRVRLTSPTGSAVVFDVSGVTSGGGATSENEYTFESFGATGDGTTNDLTALHAAIAFQRTMSQAGVQIRLFGTPGAVYKVGALLSGLGKL